MKTFGRLLTALPAHLRYLLLRERFRLPKPLDKSFQFRIARTPTELQSAYTLIHRSHQKNGTPLSLSAYHGMYLIKHFALPTTTTLIALHQEEVVGTITVIRKAAFGLPLESAFNLSQLQNKNQVIGEVSALAIHPDFRHEKGALLFPLLKFCWEHIQKNMNLDMIVLGVPKELRDMNDFFEGILGLQLLGVCPDSSMTGYYQFVREVPKRLKELFGLASLEKNLFHYFIEKKIERFNFPDRKFYKTIEPVMSPEMLRFFFVKSSDIVEKLTADERLSLAAAYPDPSYRSVIPAVKILKAPNRVRYSVNLKGRALSHPNLGLTVLNVSQCGLCFTTSAKLAGEVQIRVQVAPNRIAEVSGVIKWQDPKRSAYGVQLLMSDRQWNDFVGYMEKDYDFLAS